MSQIVFKNIGVLRRSDEDRVRETVRRIKNFFSEENINIYSAKKMSVLLDADRKYDLIISVGGDGTLLAVARKLSESDIPVMGINLGRLGFLADIAPQELETTMREIIDGQYVLEERFLLEARVERAGKTGSVSTALNDVVVSSSTPSRMIEFELYIDDRFIHTQRADGIIITTPTGSTAYSLSANGPIMDPSINAIAVVPVCPHTLSSRPLVIGGDSTVRIRVSDTNRLRPKLFCDGQVELDILTGDEVLAYKKSKPLRLLHPKDHDFYSACRNKLGWAQRH